MTPRAWRGQWSWALLLYAGVLLSPLTPYNDAFVNIPLAALLSRPVRTVAPELATTAWMGAYTFTNYLGLALILAALPHVNTRWSREIAGKLNARQVRTQNLACLVTALITVIVAGILDALGIGVDPLQLVGPWGR